MAATSKGITYPTSSDNIAPLETHFANLAQSVDNVLARCSGNVEFTGPAAADTSVSVPIAFSQPFTTAPKVVLTVVGTSTASTYVANVVGLVTTVGLTANVYRLNGTGADAGLKLTWMAFE